MPELMNRCVCVWLHAFVRPHNEGTENTHSCTWPNCVSPCIRIQSRSLLAGAKYRYSHTHYKCSLVSFLTHRRVWREKTSKHGHRLPWHSGRAILSSPHFPPLQTSCYNYHDACPPASVLENWLPRQSLISPHYPAGTGFCLDQGTGSSMPSETPVAAPAVTRARHPPAPLPGTAGDAARDEEGKTQTCAPRALKEDLLYKLNTICLSAMMAKRSAMHL